MTGDDPRYGIGDLAALGGVSRRTVRYYVQEGLLPPPFGLGRGDHYGPHHLERLRRVKALQEAGYTLDDVRRELRDQASTRAASYAAPGAVLPVSTPGQTMPRSVWQRIVIRPGVELHLAHPTSASTAALGELADWCQRHLPHALARPTDKDE